MRGRMSVVMVFCAVVAMLAWVGSGLAGWKAAAWQYHPGDLVGADCIQVAVDDLDGRLDTLEGSTNLIANAVVSTLTAISTNGATTNVVIGVDGTVAAATLSGNVAVARMAEALKAPGAIGGTTPAAGAFTTVAGATSVYSPKIGISAATGYFSVINTTQLVFIASSGAVTNVIDVDITN